MSSTLAGRHAAISIAGATLLSLLVAAQALAVGWGPAVALTSSGEVSYSAGLVGLGNDRLVAAYNDSAGVVVRRSTNAGLSWRPAQLISSTGRQVAISGRGTTVDLAWVEGRRVRYARSEDSGATFGASVALSPTGVFVSSPAIARGPHGLVAVVWLQAKHVPCCDAPWNVRARVSTNGGTTFKPAAAIGSGYAGLAVAVGNGVVYAAYEGLTDRSGQPYLRRSLDGGASWTPAVALPRLMGDSASSPHIALAATGTIAYVGYNVDDRDQNSEGYDWIQYLRTTDRGASWSAPRNLTAPTSDSFDAVLSLKNGTLHAAYLQSASIYFQSSANGLKWSQAQQVAPGGSAFGVTVAGSINVLYRSTDESGDNFWVRGATP